LNDLWDERGLDLHVQRVRDIGTPEIRDILRSGQAIPFVVAVIGIRLRWIRGDERFSFWKNELQPRLVEPSTDRVDVDEFESLGGYFYWASEWRSPDEDAPFCVLCEQKD
jgi:hypothetical protein